MTSDRPNDDVAPSAPNAPKRKELSVDELGTFLLRAGAWSAVPAAILGVVIAPGLRGNAPQAVVEGWDRVLSLTAYMTFAVLLFVVLLGGYQLARASKVDRSSRSIVSGALAVALGFVMSSALGGRLGAPASIIMAIAAGLTATTAAWCGVRAPQTRALAVVLGAFGVCALVRVSAWELASMAGDRASASLYRVSRGFATAGVILEGFGQLAAAAWLGTRSRISGRVLSNLAIAAAFVVTWGAAQGVHGDARFWQSVLHTALADASGVPPPYGLSAVATFLTAAGILLALVALLQLGQVPAVVSALSLALIARGSFDAPLRAMAVCAASIWTILAAGDDHAMWIALTTARPRTGEAPPPRPRPREERMEQEDRKTGRESGPVRR